MRFQKPRRGLDARDAREVGRRKEPAPGLVREFVPSRTRRGFKSRNRAIFPDSGSWLALGGQSEGKKVVRYKTKGDKWTIERRNEQASTESSA
jgi:hypothetical protein